MSGAGPPPVVACLYLYSVVSWCASQMKMRAVLAIIFLASAVLSEDATERPKVFRRLIPADVLRDFPGTCFASTKCATIPVGQTWDLAPFCGQSTCVQAEGEGQEGRLLELVQDCGPLPKENPKCKLSEKVNKTAPFPECCPSFDCEPGVKLEYPEIPVIKPEEKKEEKKP